MKVAIYARYSSENQRDASIADQFRICREFAQRQGWHIAAEYSDHAVSGATLMRPGFQAMMREALRKKVDIVMAEALDRFSRDQEDTAGLFKRLTFAGVNIVTLAEGDITHLHIGLKGTMNALFLKELAEKTRRGLRGRIELGQGRRRRQLRLSHRASASRTASSPPASARSCPRKPPSFDASSTTTRPARHRSRSRRPSTREGVRGPRGALWSPSTIHGNPKRGIGILHNELYIGRLVWNRQRFLKDPDTGKRVARANPPSEWITKDVPELRIIDDEALAGGADAIRERSAEVEDGRGGQALQPVPAAEVPVLGPDEVRRVRRRLHRLFARAARMLRHSRPRHMHQQADDLAAGSRGARAQRASGQVDAQGLLRGVLPRVREGDEPAADGATGRPERREARAGAGRSATIKKVIEAIIEGVRGARAEGRDGSRCRTARTRCWRSSTRPTNRRRSCTRAWPTSTARRSRNSPRRSSARTPAWKPQRCSVD